MADVLVDTGGLCLIITRCRRLSKTYYRQREEVKMTGTEQSHCYMKVSFEHKEKA
jgi:hypothetical protein